MYCSLCQYIICYGNLGQKIGLVRFLQFMNVGVSVNFPKLKISVILPIGVILLTVGDERCMFEHGFKVCGLAVSSFSKQDLMITNLEVPLMV